MNACFDNIVSLREYCTAVTPSSEIYLNDIGLNKNQIEQIITGDYENVKAIVQSTITMAVREVVSEVFNKYAKSIKAHSLVETGNIGVPPDANYSTVAGTNFRGIKLNVYNSASYLNLEIAAISLFLATTGTINVVIYDLDQNKLLATVPISAVAGQIVKVYPHLLYQSSKQYLNLFVGYDTTAAPNSYLTQVRPNMCCGNYCLTKEYVKSSGVTLSGAFTTANTETIQNTAGVGVEYSLTCDPYSWMCPQSRQLAIPIAYKVAAELYRRGWMQAPNTRTNNSTTVNKELLQQNHEWHEGKYRETMENAVKNIHLPSSTVCISCNPPVRHIIALP